jgi:ornithine--oxo-acid transaminase
LVITEDEIKISINIIKESMEELPGLKSKAEDEIIPGPEKHVEIKVDN